ncbi:MAG: HAMP domain-containing histidine kinase [Hyphomicrobiales bacterium]|nr:HAMP domain-containing histidine kinase [Hyphomicrobiales bacterium]
MTSAAPAGDRFAAVLRLFRTTAVRLSLLYLVVFTVFSVFLVVVVTHDATRILTLQIHESIDADVEALQDQYRRGGLVRLVFALEDRARRPDAGLFYVVDTSGNPIAGNVAELPPNAVADDDPDPHLLDYLRFEGGKETRHVALVRAFALDNGFRVLVGRDIGERERLRAVFRKAFRYVAGLMVVIAGLTWWFLSRRVLARIDEVSHASRRIVDGDLSGRLPVSGSGDEFDRLAVGLNEMLERIGELMGGVKGVSDAIAHDLKTPLTRLRNRVEQALSDDDPEARSEALEAALDESNALIRTFDALLMISRVEAGRAVSAADPVDVAEIAHEVAELYEPLAEDEGGGLVVEAEGPLAVRGNRELIAQALTNLVDNALKHGRSDDRAPRITLSARRDGGRIVLAVADDGPGVAPADRARIFERFTRLEASRTTPGSGLGLALVAAVVRLHKGEIAVEDAEPGLRIALRLPAVA